MLKDAWTIAIETLSWIEMQKISERMALAKTIKQLKIKSTDAIRLGYRLTIETLRRKNLIDKFINSQLGGKEIGEFGLGVQAFLRLYVYQTRISRNWKGFDLKEAEHIAQLGRAILGWKTMMEIEPHLGLLLTQNIEGLLKAAKDEERIALETFHPTWFVKYCFDIFGRTQALAILEGNLKTPTTYIRLNTLRATQEEIIQRLNGENVTLEKVEPLKHTYKVLSLIKPLNRIDSYRSGFFFVQDKASCFAAQVTDPKPGQKVLDICAAPGAKTSHLAQLMQNTGAIYSIDYSRRRMHVWRQEVGRMWVNNAEPLIADARSPLPVTLEADIAVLDPPCTSTGVFAKQPSAKWRLSPKSIEKMSDIQWMMINNCARNVKSGGLLTYSTCSITLEENEMIIERFMQRHPEFRLVEIVPKIGLPGLRGLELCQRLYPHLHHCNGFFIAKLQKQ